MARYSLSPTVVLEEVNGETVALNLDSGLYFELDDVATVMLARLREHGDIGTALAALTAEFDAPADVISRDLERFVTDLERHGIVQRDS